MLLHYYVQQKEGAADYSLHVAFICILMPYYRKIGANF